MRGVNWIGDAVMTLPAMRALRRANPDSKIVLLVKPWVSPIFEKDPNIDEMIIYSDDHKGIRGRLRLAGELRTYGFRRAVLFQNAIDAALIAFLAGIPERIGYSRDARRALLTKAVPFDKYAGSLHHIRYYLNLLDKAGFAVGDSRPWIYLSLEERLGAREKLAGLRRPVVGLNPGASYGSAKRWHPARFAEVAKRVVDELGGSVVVFGGPAETGIAEEILEGACPGSLSENAGSVETPRVMTMAGRTTLRELVALISEVDVLVTNDSGPMHIGYAVGTPLVAVFGSTSPELTGPVGYCDIVIRKEVDCAPCFERTCRKGEVQCMDLVTPADVFDAVKRLKRSGKAVFFDRDGTLCRDAGYLSRMEDFEVIHDVESLNSLKRQGYLLIGITNQSGIARGMMKEGFVKEVNDIFVKKYGFDSFYYCPHHPDEKCSCRKPEPGLLVRAGHDFGINLRKSFVVGDKDLDMQLARAVGAKGILVLTGEDNASPHAEQNEGR
ncbi:MAG: lipopolysaccharide heptosyltransferase II [Candidatus Sulfobium sp.]